MIWQGWFMLTVAVVAVVGDLIESGVVQLPGADRRRQRRRDRDRERRWAKYGAPWERKP